MSPRIIWAFGMLAVVAIGLVLGTALNYTSVVFALPILVAVAVIGLAFAFYANTRRYRPPESARPPEHRFTGREDRTPSGE